MALFVALPTALAGCGGSGSNPTDTVGGGDLRIGVGSAPAGLNNATTTDQTTVQVVSQVLEGLYAPTDKGPALALAEKAQRGAGGKEWTFTLRPGVKFSNGKPLTSADVKFSLEQARKSDSWGELNEFIAAVKTPKPNTVVVVTDEPNSSLPAVLSLFADAIIPANFGGESAEDFYRHPIGTGPFKVEKFTPGGSVTLARNTHYWKKGLPLLDQVTFTAIPEDSSRVSQLEAGAIDVAAQPPLNSLEALKQQPGVEVETYGRGEAWFLTVDVRRPPFDDLKVRQALSLLIDRQAIAESLLPGIGGPGKTWLPEATPLVDFGSIPPLETNLEKAKALLAESSAPDGFSATLNIESGPSFPYQVAQVLQQQFAEVGIKVQIEPLETGAFYEKLESKPYEIAFSNVIGDIPDPAELVTIYSAIEDMFTHLNDPALKELAQKASRATKPAEREKLYAEWSVASRDGYSVIPATQNAYVYALGSSVKDFKVISFSGTPVLTETSLGG